MAVTLHLDANRPEDIERAAELLREGGLVAFPTETVYGLGAHALDRDAVARIFAAKGRPHWDPLIVHLPTAERMCEVAEVAGASKRRVDELANAFWPGPLTMLLPRSRAVPDAVTAGRPKVGVRVPAHPVALQLLHRAGVPVAAPSANRFGHTSPTTAQHVLDDLDGRIDAVLDGGPTAVGVESTVLDPGVTPMLVYRAGAVTGAMLEAATGQKAAWFQPEPIQGTVREAMPAPGVDLRHYAPEAQLVLTGPTLEALQLALARAQGNGRLGVLLPTEWSLDEAGALAVQPWGAWADPASLAAGLFAGLRALERKGVTTMVCPLPPEGGLRDAVRDRLLKAARPRE